MPPKLHPEFGCFCLSPNLRRRAGLALAFIVFGSIAGASGVVMQIAGHEPDTNGRSVIAAIPLNTSATLSTAIVSPASPAVTAPHSRQDSASPSNSAQAAPVDAISTAAIEPGTPAATEAPSSLSLLPRSHEKRRAARTGATEAGTTLTRGANRARITGAATAAIIGELAGDVLLVGAASVSGLAVFSRPSTPADPGPWRSEFARRRD